LRLVAEAESCNHVSGDPAHSGLTLLPGRTARLVRAGGLASAWRTRWVALAGGGRMAVGRDRTTGYGAGGGAPGPAAPGCAGGWRWGAGGGGVGGGGWGGWGGKGGGDPEACSGRGLGPRRFRGRARVRGSDPGAGERRPHGAPPAEPVAGRRLRRRRRRQRGQG